MKLYLLRRHDEPGYDEYDSMVIRAESEERARKIANICCMYEGRIWDNPELVDCVELKASGEEGIIITNFVAG